jgi:hypothetical protein
MKKIFPAMWTLMMLTGASACLHSQTKPAEPDTSQKATTPLPTVDDGSAKVFMDKIEIEGRLEKPQAVFIIPGTNPEIDDINIDRTFFNEIFRSMEKKGRAVTKPAPVGQERKDVIPW